MTKYKWDAIPKEYRWVGYNRHGIIRAFRERPRAMDGFWADCNEEFTEWVGELPTVLLCEDWRESLEERPDLPNRYRLHHLRWKDSGIIDTTTNHDLTLGEVLDLLNEHEER